MRAATRRMCGQLFFGILCLLAASGCTGKHFGTSREFLTATAAGYGVTVQKNGRVDVALGSGGPVFDDAFSMVWIEGEPEPRIMAIDGRRGMRQGVNDRLGEGHALLYAHDGNELLIQTYPTQPFFTVQTSFRNRGKQPVKVKMLLPWCAGSPEAGGLVLGNGAAQSVILENGRVFSEGDDFPRRVVGGPSLSQWNSAVVNPASGRSVIAGFLTNAVGYTQVRLERSSKAAPDRFDLFRTECVYDPPIELQPGDVLRSERLYVAVAETDPLKGLERFGHAMAVTNEIVRERPFLPHGWDSWNTKFGSDIDEKSMLESLDFVDRHLKRFGWTHFAIDDGWQRMRGDWEADPDRFPHGMKWFADEIHRRGMTAGIWVDAFRVDVNAPVAQAHPEWLRKPNERAGGMLAENERILDITAPGAYEHVRDVFAKIGREWGYDALMEADFVYLLLLCDSYHDPHLTRVQVLRKGMEAIREGFGRDRFLMSMPPAPITGVYANGMRIGSDCAPVWSKVPGRWPWGGVETLTNAARRYYFAPYMWAPDPDCAYFGLPATRERWQVADQPPLTEAQSIAWLTGAALTGGVLKIGDAFADLSEHQVAILRRLLPVWDTPARPIDLFESEFPRIWSLPVKGEAGEWHIVAVFNESPGAEQLITIPLTRLGLSASEYYTVYNYWGDVYHGTITGELVISVPPGSVQLLGLRRLEDRPMLLSCNRHFTQGALDVKAVRWDPAENRLSGEIEVIGGLDYDLRILMPSPYALRRAEASVEVTRVAMVGQVLKLSFHPPADGRVTWSVSF